ncbi:MAG: glycosyltransferase family 4 protein [Thermoguttaceae bacterium]|nr:glycosyltransferase family 4 protein [Thermoguttaceae bacterium]MDW8038407.1 glycosyltransferase family 4 protein [Thermoguttaceae bacterium]
MKIGVVVEHFDPQRGGLEQWSWQFVHALRERGHQVWVISKTFCLQTARLGISCCQVPAGLSRLGFAQVVEHQLRQLDLDIIHDTGAGWYCDVFQPHWGSWLALTEQKLLLLPRWLRPWKRMLIRYLPRYREICRLLAKQYRSDGRVFLALSSQAARDFQHFHGVPPDKIRVVYNGVDIRRFHPENRGRWRQDIRRQFHLNEETLVVLIIAHNFRLKGVPTVIKAVRRLASRGVPIHLLVVGGRRSGANHNSNVRAGGKGLVSFVGPVEDTAPYYAAADLYVHPTLYDTFSLVVLEAMASGLPVITSRFNGVQELLHSGREGYVLEDPLDVEELVGKIEICCDQKLREQMSEAARQLAEQHPFDKNVEQILQIYQEVFQSKRLTQASSLAVNQSAYAEARDSGSGSLARLLPF